MVTIKRSGPRIEPWGTPTPYYMSINKSAGDDDFSPLQHAQSALCSL